MPTNEIIEKGLPDEIQIIVKVPHWHVDQGRVYWQKKIKKDSFLPLVNLVENGVTKDDVEISKLQLEAKDLRLKNKSLEQEMEIIEAQIIEAEDKYKILKKKIDSTYKTLKN